MRRICESRASETMGRRIAPLFHMALRSSQPMRANAIIVLISLVTLSPLLRLPWPIGLRKALTTPVRTQSDLVYATEQLH